MIQDATDRLFSERRIDYQLPFFHGKYAKPRKPTPTLGKMVSLVLPKTDKKPLITRTGLSNVDDLEAGIVKDVNTLLLTEIYL